MIIYKKKKKQKKLRFNGTQKEETYKLIRKIKKKHLNTIKKLQKLILIMQMLILEWQVVKKNLVNMKKPLKTTISL
jgi:predicted transcriptional regulator